jgi:hypothetical protein
LQGSEEQTNMPNTETTHRVLGSQPSKFRTDLNIAEAVVAVGLCLVILALLASAPAPSDAHHGRPATHVHAIAAPRT